MKLRHRHEEEYAHAVEEAASMVEVLGQDRSPETIPLLKDVVRRFVNRIGLTFSPVARGKRVVNVLERGRLEIRSPASYAATFLNTPQHGSPRKFSEIPSQSCSRWA